MDLQDLRKEASSDEMGGFLLQGVNAGKRFMRVEAPGFVKLTNREVIVPEEGNKA